MPDPDTNQLNSFLSSLKTHLISQSPKTQKEYNEILLYLNQWVSNINQADQNWNKRIDYLNDYIEALVSNFKVEDFEAMELDRKDMEGKVYFVGLRNSGLFLKFFYS